MKHIVCIAAAMIGCVLSAIGQVPAPERTEIINNEKLSINVDDYHGVKCYTGWYIHFTYVYIKNKTSDNMKVRVMYVLATADYNKNQYIDTKKTKEITLKPHEETQLSSQSEKKGSGSCLTVQYRNFELVSYSVKPKNYETEW